VLVCWCVGVLVCWCVGVLVCYGTDCGFLFVGRVAWGVELRRSRVCQSGSQSVRQSVSQAGRQAVRQAMRQAGRQSVRQCVFCCVSHGCYSISISLWCVSSVVIEPFVGFVGRGSRILGRVVVESSVMHGLVGSWARGRGQCMLRALCISVFSRQPSRSARGNLRRSWQK